MTLLRLILRSLWCYRRTGLVVAFGLAVAVAAITGSLIVGDSVHGSLRDTALARLGWIDDAVTSTRFLRESLADDTARRLDTAIIPLIITPGAVRNAATDAVLPAVQVVGCDQRFWPLFPATPAPELNRRAAAVNEALARDLGVKTGDTVLVSVDRARALPSTTLFAHRSREETVQTLRLTVTAILPATGAGGFTLNQGTAAPRTLFLALPWLQDALEKPGQVNTFLSAMPAVGQQSVLQQLRAERLEDHGLHWAENATQHSLCLQSDALVLPESVVKHIQNVAAIQYLHGSATSVYLADSITADNGRQISYAMMVAINPLWDTFMRMAKTPSPYEWEWPNAIRLNNWAADDLGVHVGDRVTINYLVPNADGTYRTASKHCVVRGIDAISGLAADATLVPAFKGITDADSMDAWSTPFPVDMHRVTPRDEAYWKQYRVVPKAFINPQMMGDIWTTATPAGAPQDWITGIYIPAERMHLLKNTRETLSTKLLAALPATPLGTSYHPLRLQALQIRQTTDFGQLFLSMSFFIVLAAAGLAAMLMRLLVERRASEAGVMLACGLAPRQVQHAILGEGFVLTLAGIALGVPLGVLYAAGVMRALTTWWVVAVGTSALWLHVQSLSLLIGAVSGLAIGHLAIHWGIRRLRREPVLGLLAGWQAMYAVPQSGNDRRVPALLIVALGATGVLLLGAVTQRISSTPAFFGIGALLLVACLCAVHLALGRALRKTITVPTISRLAWRSAAVNRGRSLLVIGLLAAAAFIIVTVAVNARDFSRRNVHDRASGTGGFALRAESTLPLRIDFSTPAGRKLLGFTPDDEALFIGTKIYPLLLSAGDDVSCLNLNSTPTPRVLGVSDTLIDRGGFIVQSIHHHADSWTLLQETQQSSNTLSAFGDADSVMWSLHSKLGGEYPIADNSRVNFVGLLPGSIFAGEILISEENFRRLYPEIDAPRCFLIDTPPGREKAVADALRRNLGDLGLEVKTTQELLNAYIGVQNTYLSTFLVLGGLGVLLGTVGLVAVLLRNAFERRREFALLLATGYHRRGLTALLLWENVALMLTGLCCGTLAALTAVAPHLLSVEARVNWSALAVVLGAILAVGILACMAAAHAATRGQLLTALREE